MVAIVFNLENPTFLAKSHIFIPKCTKGGIHQFRISSQKIPISYYFPYLMYFILVCIGSSHNTIPQWGIYAYIYERSLMVNSYHLINHNFDMILFHSWIFNAAKQIGNVLILANLLVLTIKTWTKKIALGLQTSQLGRVVNQRQTRPAEATRTASGCQICFFDVTTSQTAFY